MIIVSKEVFTMIVKSIHYPFVMVDLSIDHIVEMH